GPEDLALGRPGAEADLRAGEPEVVELLGVERRQGLPLPRLAEVAGGVGGRFGGVVPAREGHQEHGTPEAGGAVMVTEGIHAPLSYHGARAGSALRSARRDGIPRIVLPLVPRAGEVAGARIPQQPDAEQADRGRDARVAVGDDVPIGRDAGLLEE